MCTSIRLANATAVRIPHDGDGDHQKLFPTTTTPTRRRKRKRRGRRVMQTTLEYVTTLRVIYIRFPGAFTYSSCSSSISPFVLVPLRKRNGTEQAIPSSSIFFFFLCRCCISREATQPRAIQFLFSVRFPPFSCVFKLVYRQDDDDDDWCSVLFPPWDSIDCWRKARRRHCHFNSQHGKCFPYSPTLSHHWEGAVL